MSLALRDYPEAVTAATEGKPDSDNPCFAPPAMTQHHDHDPQRDAARATSGQRLSAAAIEARLRAALTPETLVVEDDSHHHAGHAGAREGGHFAVRIVAACFAGRSRLARHRLVYDALGPLAARGIHALTIEALAPGEG